VGTRRRERGEVVEEIFRAVKLTRHTSPLKAQSEELSRQGCVDYDASLAWARFADSYFIRIPESMGIKLSFA